MLLNTLSVRVANHTLSQSFRDSPELHVVLNLFEKHHRSEIEAFEALTQAQAIAYQNQPENAIWGHWLSRCSEPDLLQLLHIYSNSPEVLCQWQASGSKLLDSMKSDFASTFGCGLLDSATNFFYPASRPRTYFHSSSWIARRLSTVLDNPVDRVNLAWRSVELHIASFDGRNFRVFRTQLVEKKDVRGS